MKVMMRDLVNIADEKIYPVDIDYKEIKHNDYLRGIKDVKGEIVFYYDYDEKLKISYYLEGLMICPDTISLKDVEIHFNIEDEQYVVLNQYEDGFYLIDGIEFSDFVAYIIIPEAPISVEKSDETMYHSGDGWTLFSEKEYNKFAKNRIDPRLEKLLEFKEED